MRDTISEAVSDGMKQTQRAIELAPADEHALKRNPPHCSREWYAPRATSRPTSPCSDWVPSYDSELKAYLLFEFAKVCRNCELPARDGSDPRSGVPADRSKVANFHFGPLNQELQSLMGEHFTKVAFRHRISRWGFLTTFFPFRP